MPRYFGFARSFGVLTHVRAGSDGTSDAHATMVDVSQKVVTMRKAIATAKLIVPLEARFTQAEYQALKNTAVVAGVLAAKKTDALIPMCHSLPLDSVSIEVSEPAPLHATHGQGAPQAQNLQVVSITATACTTGKTGVEMEAYVGATLAGLTLIDMLKGACPPGSLVLQEVRLVRKTGGKSDYEYKGDAEKQADTTDGLR